MDSKKRLEEERVDLVRYVKAVWRVLALALRPLSVTNEAWDLLGIIKTAIFPALFAFPEFRVLAAANWMWIVPLLLLWAGVRLNLLFVDQKEQEDDLVRLVEMRNEGYLLRNRGQFPTEEEIKPWHTEVETWTAEVISHLSKLSRPAAETLRVLGQYTPVNIMLLATADAEAVQILTARLIRLDGIIERLLQSPKSSKAHLSS